MTRTIDLEDLVVVVVTLTLDGGDDLAGGHPQAPLASAETLEQGGWEAEHRGQEAGDHQVQDKQVPGVPVGPLPCKHELCKGSQVAPVSILNM